MPELCKWPTVCASDLTAVPGENKEISGRRERRLQHQFRALVGSGLVLQLVSLNDGRDL